MMETSTYNSISLNSIASSLAQIMNIEPPLQSNAPADVLVHLPSLMGKGVVDRIIMYNPDAIGLEIFQKYTALFEPVLRHIQLTLPLLSVMPSVTPVCFGTMYTGAMPEVHGIRSYSKPVIQIDSLFDSLIRSGKKAAIVAENDCSMSRIYLNRAMDYFFYPTVDEVNDKALELIRQDAHDFIAVYNGNYDSTMHKHGPDAKEAISALKQNISAFDTLAKAIEDTWKKKHTTLIGFAPDHGCHEIDGGCGSHGLDMASDMNIVHLYGVIPKTDSI